MVEYDRTTSPPSLTWKGTPSIYVRLQSGELITNASGSDQTHRHQPYDVNLSKFWRAETIDEATGTKDDVRQAVEERAPLFALQSSSREGPSRRMQPPLTRGQSCMVGGTLRLGGAEICYLTISTDRPTVQSGLWAA
nr:hypothetical protein CFP56_28621 [Quercus suber]